MSAAGSGVRRCAICRRPVDARWRPFCSKRCADIDLGRWLGETYRIPAEDAPGDEMSDDGGQAEDDVPPRS
ncbi:MAG: DNA gyrase inhibitor YacG [Rhodospirillales bacterium]|jgi:hypothetical protein|nr:DNA gyrase inhibitor YacG [Rhodospirillales bacterium]